MPATITKVIVGDRYYEATTADGEAASFTVSQRCPPDNAADVVLGVLRDIAANGRAEGANGRYMFTIPGSGSANATAGTVVVDGGYIQQLAVTSGALVPMVTIESVGTAPTISAPANASPGSMTCG